MMTPKEREALKSLLIAFKQYLLADNLPETMRSIDQLIDAADEFDKAMDEK